MNIINKLNFNKFDSNIICNDISYSYKELNIDIKKFGSIICDRSLVFIITENSYDCLVGYCGSLYNNSVVALINNSINKRMLNNILKRLNDKTNLHVLIVKPNINCSTRKIYRSINKYSKSSYKKINKFYFNKVNLAKSGNDLESVVFKLDKGDIGKCKNDKKKGTHGGYGYAGRQELTTK